MITPTGKTELFVDGVKVGTGVMGDYKIIDTRKIAAAAEDVAKAFKQLSDTIPKLTREDFNRIGPPRWAKPRNDEKWQGSGKRGKPKQK